MRFPTIDLQERLLRNGGGLPRGLFRQNYYRSKRSQGVTPGASDPIMRLVEELRHMLRDLTNLNVRQPSHMAPPFRAVQFTYQVALETVLTEPVPIPINGNLLVPAGTIAVLNFVSWSQSPTPAGATVPPAWDIAGGAAATEGLLSILRNGSTIPGLDAISPAITVGINQLSGVDYTVQEGHVPPLPVMPTTLYQGDSLSWFATAPSGGRYWLQVSGYTYPIEVDGDGVRGTLADRG